MEIVAGALVKVEESDIKEGTFQIPSKVREIGQGAFAKISNLVSIVIPKNVRKIGLESFCCCENLENVFIENGLWEIDRLAFRGCRKLKEITLPKTLTEIGVAAFKDCKALQEIIVPEGVSEIKKNIFSDCKNLQKLSLPTKLHTFSFSSINGCDSLKELSLPKTITAIDSLPKCNGLEAFYFYDKSAIGVLGREENLVWMSKKGNVFCLSKEKQSENSVYIDQNEKVFWYYLGWNNKEKVKNDLQHKRNSFVYKQLESALDRNEFKRFVLKGEFKYFNTIKFSLDCDEDSVTFAPDKFKDVILNEEIKPIMAEKKESINESQLQSLVVLLYNLGGFLPEKEFKRNDSKGRRISETINYSQKVTEFIKNMLTEGVLTWSKIVEISQGFKFEGFKRDFTDFFIKRENLQALLKESENQIGYIARAYNYFEKVQRLNTSNKGKQRQLKPTIEAFNRFFVRKMFKGVTEETEDLAKGIQQFFTSQESFNKAVEIDRERKKNKTPKNILSYHLKEDDVFDKIKSYTKQIETEAVDAVQMLLDLSQTQYTFEMLEKDDVTNFILGKLCSCCAHLEGIGTGVMKASIVRPDVQNMVIRDRSGNIVAKSTVYVNKKNGYAVFNTVSVSDEIMDMKIPDSQYIYQTFIRGANKFIDEYNKENLIPIKKAVVGRGGNSLEFFFAGKHAVNNRMLLGINFANYQDDGHDYYYGDWDGQQFVIAERSDEDIKRLRSTNKNKGDQCDESELV